jgi:hypothetical protein
MSEARNMAVGAGLTLAAGTVLVLIARRKGRPFAGVLRDGFVSEAYELRVHIDNTAALAKYKHAMRGAITKKVCSGQFDASKATKGFRAIVDEAAKDYAGPLQARYTFPGAVRKKVAADLTADLKSDINRCLTKGDCDQAPPELSKCAATAKPLAGRAAINGLGRARKRAPSRRGLRGAKQTWWYAVESKGGKMVGISPAFDRKADVEKSRYNRATQGGKMSIQEGDLFSLKALEGAKTKVKQTKKYKAALARMRAAAAREEARWPTAPGKRVPKRKRK